jgi:hypothetical protein
MSVYAANTNESIFRYCVEDTPGVISGDEVWYVLEPNDVTNFTSTITTVARNPISIDRAPRKGTITDLEAAVEFDDDLTIESFRNFSDGFLFANWKSQVDTEPTSVSGGAGTSDYNHAALSYALAEYTLVYARDFSTSANNGLKIVNAGSTTTVTEVKETLTAEASPPTGARIDVCGFQGDSGDIRVDADGNITSEVAGYDFTDGTADGRPDFYVGQFIYVGGGTTGTSFATAGSGFARITAIEAHKLTIDKVSSSTWATDTGTGKTIQIFTGDWIRTVAIDHADFLNKTYQFEAEYSDLDDGAGGTEDGFEYIIGCSPNTLTLNMPLTDKATVSWAFIGLDGEPLVDTAKTKGSTVDPTDTAAYNTTSDFARLSLKDLSGNDLGAYFKDLTLTINNNIVPEKVLGTLGSVINSIGDLNITATTQVLFTSADVSTVVRNNITVTLDWVLNNEDGGLYFDLPAITLGTATKSFPRNETVKLDLDINAFKDNTLGYVMSVTDFPYLPV